MYLNFYFSIKNFQNRDLIKLEYITKKIPLPKIPIQLKKREWKPNGKNRQYILSKDLESYQHLSDVTYNNLMKFVEKPKIFNRCRKEFQKNLKD